MQNTKYYVGTMQNTMFYVGTMQNTKYYVGTMKVHSHYVGTLVLPTNTCWWPLPTPSFPHEQGIVFHI